jgi:ComF family protein
VHRPAFDRVASAVRFEGDARKMLHGFKFKGHLWLKDDFSDWMEGAARARFKVEDVDLVLPVPLGFLRRVNRGYNQCDYLSQELARRLGCRMSKRILKRIGSPRCQSSLSRDERIKNVKDTFAVRSSEMIAGKTVLVVDDVMTTGSTLSECARVLKRAGAGKVWGITLFHA